jgi:hypothetical protein
MVFKNLAICTFVLLSSIPVVAMKHGFNEPSVKRPKIWDMALQGTPLHDATVKGDIFEFRIRAEAGANPNESNSAGNRIIITTQLGKYFSEENREIAYDILVSKGANVRAAQDVKTGMGLGHHFSLISNHKMLDKALSDKNNYKQRIDVNQKDKDGCTPLFYTDNPATVDLLYRGGAHLDARDNKSRTALHTVAREDTKPVAEFLIKLNPHLVVFTNAQGETPFEFADARFDGGVNEDLKNEKTARKVIVDGLFAPKQMGNPLFALDYRARGVKNPKTGITNFGVKHIRG